MHKLKDVGEQRMWRFRETRESAVLALLALVLFLGVILHDLTLTGRLQLVFSSLAVAALAAAGALASTGRRRRTLARRYVGRISRGHGYLLGIAGGVALSLLAVSLFATGDAGSILMSGMGWGLLTGVAVLLAGPLGRSRRLVSTENGEESMP